MPLIIVVLLWIAGEAWLLARLSERIGGAWVVALLALGVVAGVVLIRHQGMRVIRELRTSVGRGELPAATMIEGVLVLFAGLLLILPGLLSDLIALSLLFLGLRRRLALRIGEGLAKARPDLRQPVTLEGQFRRK